MPPAIPMDSDAESESEEKVEEIKVDSKDEKKDAEKKPAVEAKDDGDEEGDEDDDESDGGTYIVEKIIEHRSDFADDILRYCVKWKGYEKKTDRTWEPEENLDGARDILEEYWESIGGKPVPGEDKKVAKKRKRQGTESAKPESETVVKRQRKSKGGRNNSNGAIEQDIDPGPMYGVIDVSEGDWKPPVAMNGNWDSLVQSVDTVVRENSDGELWGYLIWNKQHEEGRLYRSKAKLSTLYKACPQRMLKFYEKHLVFTAAGEEDQGNS